MNMRPRHGWRRWLAATALLLAGLDAAVLAEDYPQQYALLIGLDRYRNEGSLFGGPQGVARLQFAVRDASHLDEMLKAQGYQTTLLDDTRADRDAIISELVRFAETVQPRDSFLLYYAGHGVRRARNGRIYWLNYDGDPQRPDLYGLRLAHLLELVQEIGAQRKLVLLDHCYAGGDGGPIAVGAGTIGRGDAPVAADDAAARDGIPLIVRNGIAEAQRDDPGLIVVAASRGLAFELVEQQHGVFTFALLEAMRTPTNADPTRDGVVTVSDLLPHLKSRVRELSSVRQFEQNPVARSPGGDLGDLLAWAPFLRELQAPEVATSSQRYREQLSQWAGQQRLDVDVQDALENALEAWSSRPALMSPAERQMIYALRRAVDAPLTPDVDQLTSALSKRVRFLSAN